MLPLASNFHKRLAINVVAAAGLARFLAGGIEILLELNLHYLFDIFYRKTYLSQRRQKQLTKAFIFLVSLQKYLLIFSLAIVCKPILHLFLGEARLVAELLLLLFGDVGVLNVIEKPLLQNFSSLRLENLLFLRVVPSILFMNSATCVFIIGVPIIHFKGITRVFREEVSL